MDAKEAFATLFKIVGDEMRIQQQSGALYLGEGDTVHARDVIEQVEKLRALTGKVQQLQTEWEYLLPPEPLVEVISVSPQLVRTSPGQVTPHEAYYRPILQALIEMGGQGATGLVLDRVGELMADVFSDRDCEHLEAAHSLRWRNAAKWARMDMVQKGYLKPKSPYGVWEITDEGRDYLSR